MTPSEDPETRSVRSPDYELVRRVLEGDRGASERLAERLQLLPDLLSEINHQRGSRLSSHDLEDLSQDVLLIVWGKLDQFRGFGTLEGWLHRFCLLEYMNRLRIVRRRERRTLLQPDPELTGVEPPGDGPGTLDTDVLEASLAELDPSEEEVVRLKHFEELTFKRIGELLGVPLNTVKSRYYRGIAWLRRRLARRDEEVPR